MQVKSIAECSKRSILQYFGPSLSYQLSLRSLFGLFLSGCLRQVLLYLENRDDPNQLDFNESFFHLCDDSTGLTSNQSFISCTRPPYNRPYLKSIIFFFISQPKHDCAMGTQKNHLYETENCHKFTLRRFF